jgi:hypothetical protein
VATWADLLSFIRTEYEVIDEGQDEIRLLIRYPTDDEEPTSGRSQSVVVAREILDRREDWVQIASPFARVDQVDLWAVLKEVGSTTVVGGVAIIGEFLVIRHSLPLIHLDINEFHDPLVLITGTAELLERQFVGTDDF